MSEDKKPETAPPAESPVDSLVNTPVEKLEKVELTEEEAASVQELDADGLDHLLKEDDPEFYAEMTKIQSDSSLTLEDLKTLPSDIKQEEIRQAWQNGGPIRRRMIRLFPKLPKVVMALGAVKDFLKAKFYALRIRLKDALLFIFRRLRLSLSKSWKSVAGGIKKKKDVFGIWFSRLSGIKKLGLFLLFLATISIFGFAGLIIKKGEIFPQKSLFVQSIAEVADRSFEFDPVKDLEPFYDNLRVIAHVIEITKLVVNLTNEGDQHPNPMAAFEFFIEGMSPEVVVEIKDRETEARHLMQRKIESFTFTKLETVEGKQELLDHLKAELNTFLTTGKVKKVFIKTIVLKP